MEDWRSQFAQEAREERPDLALLCLLIGTEAEPELGQAGMDAAEIELDRLAGLVPYGPKDPVAWARALEKLLGEQYGFGGTPAEYGRLDSSLLHQVLRRRRGLPITLSVVWMEVARRAGAPVYGVALPGHFVVGFGDPGERVLADPFAGGRPMTGADAGLLVAGATGERLDPSLLLPADTLDIVLRVLNNIRAWAVARPEHSAVALWALDLALLLPSHPAKLRYERARVLIQRGEFRAGAGELEAYADVVEPVDRAAAEELRQQAMAARSRLN
ncbi:transglutaminase family protein [Streptomyces sp. MUM 203J]|uniref:transglutaminase family protein n=1 Tax=Streptomyces sp. MUM 203J TaxID=2791990 RepID=UPI001F04AF1D|nr:transglutaminase-like domain-containing protein [Streptomyces sp. MUM 203J]MCH0540084.1 transglutaminase family protein [Streptomyces sp. MUM 203J]